ncbi:hypothetical protein ACH44C_29000 [Streptomyces purpureus]|uniref:hypothetical protein n=1 Tax=Streptomyces purpureus TaxID=1951 RepID=UPI0037A2C018
MRADRARPDAQRRWQEWRRAPLPAFETWYASENSPHGPAADSAAVESFRELTAPGPHVDEVCDGTADPAFYVVDDVWDGQSDAGMFISVHSKEYAVSALFHAVGPDRAALLPGWCGNFLLLRPK